MTDISSSSGSSRPDSPSLAKVLRGDLCAGCGGCALVAPDQIRMEPVAPGYLRPVQTGAIDATAEQKIAAACPGLGQRVTRDGRRSDPLWGPYVDARTGHATDAEMRFAASSGGGISAILLHLVQSDRVDAVVHNGADAALPIGNVPVISTSSEEIRNGAGSRYAPSAPLAALAKLRDDPRRFAFVGKPCDVAALRALQQGDAALAAQFPVLLSFFCAGVPSTSGGEAVLKRLGTQLDEVEQFRFRGNGWPGFATAITKDGRELSMSYHDSWGGILSNHVQNRCKLCADGTGKAADIVCADAWACDEAGYPLFDEQDGTSLIMARTPLGADLVQEAEAAGAIATEDFAMKTLAAIQPGQTKRRRALMARLSALAVLGRPRPHYEGMDLRACARQNGMLTNIKNFAGMLRRALR